MADAEALQRLVFVTGATSNITASPDTITADGVTASTITVQLKDASGNPLQASGGSLVIKASAGTVSATTDNGDGRDTATLTSTAPGDATASFTLAGVAGQATATVHLISAAAPVAGPPFTTAPVSGSSVLPAADGTANRGLNIQAGVQPTQAASSKGLELISWLAGFLILIMSLATAAAARVLRKRRA